jgi:uncharacterized protein YdhG (YjbR/CyaY superfamily)
MNTNKPESIDSYISSFPKDIQKHLEDIRATIKQAAPEAEEAIKYAMPTFVLNGNLVHFAAYQHHIGFYPAPEALEFFKDLLSEYKSSKGAVQFPLDKPMPLDIISEIVVFRVRQNLSKSKKKK